MCTLLLATSQSPDKLSGIMTSGVMTSDAAQQMHPHQWLGSVVSSESMSSKRCMLAVQVLEACLSTGAMRNTRVPTLPKSPLSPDKRIARLQAEETSSAASSAASKGSSHFGGHQFWGALQNAGLEREVWYTSQHYFQNSDQNSDLHLSVKTQDSSGKSTSNNWKDNLH